MIIKELTSKIGLELIMNTAIIDTGLEKHLTNTFKKIYYT